MMSSYLELNLPSALVVTVCSGSNTAHFAAGYLASKKSICVHVLTRNPKNWAKQLTICTEKTSWERKGTIVGTLASVTNDPSSVIPASDIVLISAPAYAHAPLLESIAPFLKKKTILGCLYCQGGFNWKVESILKEKIPTLDGYFGLQNIPWVCKATTYGHMVQLYGAKKKLVLASFPPDHCYHYSLIVSLLFDIPTVSVPNFLCLTLSPSNQIIHPARYSTIFNDLERVPVERFNFSLYAEFDDAAAETLQKLDNELQRITEEIQKRYPKELDLDSVLPIKDRIIDQYANDISDKTNLKTIFRTNKGYAGCKTPHIKEGQYVLPALESRLFWEDIPYGLCVLKSLAQMVNVKTPAIDSMIRWHQKFMKKEYITANNELNLSLIHETGAPEAYGMKNISEVVASSLRRN